MLAIPGIALSPYFAHALDTSDHIDKGITDLELTTLYHFIETIIPGTETYCPLIVGELCHEFYGFQKYIKSLTKNLNESAIQKFQRSFIGLNEPEKMMIVDEGTKEGIFKKQIFYAAIYVIQVIVFTGLSDKNQSCPIIDFPGNKRGPFVTYNHYGRLNVKTSGINGNPI